MKLVIHDVDAWGKNIRAWKPEDRKTIAQSIFVHIGEKGKKGSDIFSLWLYTPKGLQSAADKSSDGSAKVLANRAILVMSEFDVDIFLQWLDKTVKSCEGGSWMECVEKLKLYFLWEYENYK